MPESETTVELDTLRGLAEDNDLARAAFEMSRDSSQDLRVSKLLSLESRLRATGTDFTRSDLRAFLRALEGAGCGTYVIGRRGNPSRFKWSVPMTLVGRYALGDDASGSRLSTATVQDEDDADDAGAAESPPDKVYVFPLR